MIPPRSIIIISPTSWPVMTELVQVRAELGRVRDGRDEDLALALGPEQPDRAPIRVEVARPALGVRDADAALERDAVDVGPADAQLDERDPRRPLGGDQQRAPQPREDERASIDSHARFIAPARSPCHVDGAFLRRPRRGKEAP
jgi:hypothetical protein